MVVLHSRLELTNVTVRCVLVLESSSSVDQLLPIIVLLASYKPVYENFISSVTAAFSGTLTALLAV